LKYLEDNNMKDSEQYSLAQEAVAQGEYYYGRSDNTREVYRENIMGIYGAAHTGLDAMNHTNSVPCMANQLKELYGEALHSEDLSGLAKDIEPERVDSIKVNGKDYEASYFGKDDISSWSEYAFREFWRLENAYDDFKNKPKTNNVLPYDNYPMPIETGQVFVIDYTQTNGLVVRKYYRSDGFVWDGRPSTEEFTAE
jgi:hypothetical protein